MNYNTFLEELYSYQDLEYKKFHSKLVKDNNKIIGVRIPILKELARKLAKDNYQAYINNCTHKTYEECVIHGLIIGYAKVDFEEKLTMLDAFLPYNDNWATNDTVAANLKDFKKNREVGYQKILALLKNNKTYYVRFALVLLLDHYLVDDYIDRVLEIANNINSEEYYINMANAWLISACYIKYPDKTKKFLETTKIDNWTYNKAISKINDSYRVSKASKEYLNKLKR